MRPTLAFLLLLGLLTLLAQKADARPDAALQEIMNKHLDALGGWRAWSQVESIRLRGDIERDSTRVNFVIIKKRPEQIRVTLTFPASGSEKEPLQMIRAHDGRTAWAATRRAGGQYLIQQPLESDEAETLQNDATVLPKLVHLWRSNAELIRLPSSDINGQPVYVIQARPKDSETTYHFYLSTENYRTIRYTHATNGVTTTTDLSRYRQIDGLWLPEVSIIQDAYTGRSVLRTRSVKVGVGIYEEYFRTADLQL